MTPVLLVPLVIKAILVLLVHKASASQALLVSQVLLVNRVYQVLQCSRVLLVLQVLLVAQLALLANKDLKGCTAGQLVQLDCVE